MKKKRICLYFSILLLFCQCFIGVAGVSALEDGQRAAIVDHCDEIRENLRNVQKKDRQTRVYLGRVYESVLNKFVTPLNLRLVENNKSDTALLENQSLFAEVQKNFKDDYVSYQQVLEETIQLDCKSEPERFYESLEIARKGRRVLGKDIAKLRELITKQVKIVLKIKEGL